MTGRRVMAAPGTSGAIRRRLAAALAALLPAALLPAAALPVTVLPAAVPLTIGALALAGAPMLGPGPAAAAIPETAYRTARRKAELHVQMTVTAVYVPRETPGKCVVEGKVVRVFRGRIEDGADVTLEIRCRRESDKERPSGIQYLDAESLQAAKFLEAYINSTPDGGHSVALWQQRVIEAPSDTPQFPIH